MQSAYDSQESNIAIHANVATIQIFMNHAMRVIMQIIKSI